MIKFRQKSFGMVMGMLASAGVSSVASGVQNKKNMEQQNDIARAQAQQQEKFQKEQMKQNEQFQKQNLKMQKEEQKIQKAAVRKNVDIGGASTGMFSDSSQKSYSVLSAPPDTFKGGFMPGFTAATIAIEGVSNKKSRKANEEEHNSSMQQNQENFTAQMAENKRVQENALAEKRAALDAKKNALKNKSFSEEQKEFAVPVSVLRTLAKGRSAITKTANTMANSKVWKGISSNKTFQNARGFAKDVYTVGKDMGAGQGIADMAAMGATFTAGGYLVDKAISLDAKKNGIPLNTGGASNAEPEKKGSKLKKAVIGTGATLGTAATTLVLARKRKLRPDTFKSAAKTVGTSMKKGFKNQLFDEKTGRLAKGNLAFTGAFMAFPAVGYISNRNQLKNQVAQSQQPEERQYAAIPAGVTRFVKTIPARARLMRANTKKAIKAAPKGVANFLSFGAGVDNQAKFGQKLTKLGETKLGSGSEWTQSVGNFFKDGGKVVGKDGNVRKMATFGKKALLTTGGIAAGCSVMTIPMTVGDKAVKKVAGVVDKNAFAYEKSQNQQVPQA